MTSRASVSPAPDPHDDPAPQPDIEGQGPAPLQPAAEEWPKKVRTLSAAELDRLTIDGEGRFYWDGHPVNYTAPVETAPAPEPSDTAGAMPTLLPPDSADRLQGAAAAPVSSQAVPSRDAPPLDSTTPDAPAPPSAADRLAKASWLPARDRPSTIALTRRQSLAVVLAVSALLIAAAALAVQTAATVHGWGCRTGLLTAYCPQPGGAPANTGEFPS